MNSIALAVLVSLRSFQGDASQPDLHGDPLPAGALQRIGTIRFRYPIEGYTEIYGLAYLPDGKRIAASGTGGVVIWDVGSGKIAQVLRHGHSCIGVSPDGTHVAAAGGGKAFLWSLTSHGEPRTFEIDQGFAGSTLFSPDSTRLACGIGKGEIRVWDVSSGNLLKTLRGQGTFLLLAWSPDGSRIASVGDQSLRLWDVAGAREIFALPMKNALCVAYSPNGKLVAVGGLGGELSMLDAETGKVVLKLQAASDSVSKNISRIAFSPDGSTLVAASGYGGLDGALQCRRVEDGKLQWEHQNIGQGFASIAFSPDGRTLASAGVVDGAVRFWNADNGEDLPVGEGHRGGIEGLAFSPGGRILATVGMDGTARLWSTTTSRCLRQLEGHDQSVKAVAFSPDGTEMATSDFNRVIRLFSVESGHLVRKMGSEIEVHRVGFHLAFVNDGKSLVSGETILGKFDLATGKRVLEYPPEENLRQIRDFSSIALSPDGRFVAAGGQGVTVWDGATGRIVWSRSEGYGGAVAVLPDANTLLIGRDLGEPLLHERRTSVELWGLASGKMIASLGPSRIDVLAVSRDGRTLATLADHVSVQLWEIASRRKLVGFNAEVGIIRCLDFSPDGRMLAAGGTHSAAMIWSIPTLVRAGAARKSMEECWTALGSDDPIEAERAIWDFADQKEVAEAFLKDHLWHPPADSATVARWIADLDNDDITVREKSTRALSAAADEEALRTGLKITKSAEARTRIQSILDSGAEIGPPLAESILASRAIRILELRNAVATLGSLSKGPWTDPITREVRNTFERMDRNRRPGSDSSGSNDRK